MAEAAAVPQNGLLSAADILGKLTPLFFGSGTTKGSESSTTTSPANASLEEIITQALGQSANPMAVLQPQIDNIMATAARNFAPVVGQQNAAGMYNTNTLSMLSSLAQAEAGRQSAQVVTDFVTNQQKIATSAASSLANTNKTTSGNTTRATGAALDPINTIMGIGGAVAANKIGGLVSPQLDKGIALLKKQLGFDSTPSVTADTNQVMAVNGSAGTGVDGLAVGGGDQSVASTFASINPDAVITGGGSSAFDTATGIASAGVDLGTEAGVSAGESVAEGVGAGAADSAAEDVGSGILEDAGASWIICTELMLQKRMPKKYWATGLKVFEGYWEYGKQGYYLWAIPSVQHLRRHPRSVYSRCMDRCFNWRAEYLAACAGVPGARNLIKGQLVSTVLWVLCTTLACTVVPFLGRQDYRKVYING